MSSSSSTAMTTAIVSGSTGTIGVSLIEYLSKQHPAWKPWPLPQSKTRLNDHFWIAPHSIHGKTLQQIGDAIAVKAGRPAPVKFTVLGPCLVHVMSPFMGFMSEMREMLPMWTSDYTVDDTDFRKAFGVEATPEDEALACSINLKGRTLLSLAPDNWQKYIVEYDYGIILYFM